VCNADLGPDATCAAHYCGLTRDYSRMYLFMMYSVSVHQCE